MFGFFLSDHFYGLAAEFSRRGMFDGALEYYTKAIKYNPLTASYHQYRAYILRQTMDMQRTYSPVKGDAKGERLNDYERALRDLDLVQSRAPNHALLHQAYGEFYYSYAVYYTKLSQTAPLAYQRRAGLDRRLPPRPRRRDGAGIFGNAQTQCAHRRAGAAFASAAV